MKIETRIRFKLFDPANHVQCIEERRAESFVNNFAILNNLLMTAATAQQIRDTSNVLQTVAVGHLALMNVNAPFNDMSFGLVIGTGTNNVQIGDYKLQTPVTTANFLVSSNRSVGLVTDLTKQNSIFGIERTFTNLTGGFVTIQESGIIFSKTGAPAYKFLVERTTFAPFIIPASYGVVAAYSIQIAL